MPNDLFFSSDYYLICEAVEITGRTARQLRRLMVSGHLQGIVHDYYTLFLRSSIDEFAERMPYVPFESMDYKLGIPKNKRSLLDVANLDE